MRGNDREGMQEHQAAWAEWSENLPKKTEAQTTPPADQQPDAQTHEVPLPPPPTVETANLPPTPQPPPSYAPPSPTQGSGMGRGTKLVIGGCVALVLLALLTVGGCLALVATVEPPTDSESGSSEDKQESGSSKSSKGGESAVAIGEPVTVGDVQWTVTDARKADQIRDVFTGDPKRGNFVIVDFDFTNRSNEAVTLDQRSLALIDSSGSKSEVDTDNLIYVPEERDIWFQQVNPGVTRQGRAIFDVASNTSGYRLQAGDTNLWSDENGYVDLGF